MSSMVGSKAGGEWVGGKYICNLDSFWQQMLGKCAEKAVGKWGHDLKWQNNAYNQGGGFKTSWTRQYIFVNYIVLVFTLCELLCRHQTLQETTIVPRPLSLSQANCSWIMCVDMAVFVFVHICFFFHFTHICFCVHVFDLFIFFYSCTLID